MAIRIRVINSETIAVYAAKTKPKQDDLYLDDKQHHALAEKFLRDFNFENLLKPNPPFDNKVYALMTIEENL